MKNLKLSFAFIIAVLAVSITIAANASVFGKRVITRCFTQLTLRNIPGSTANLDATIPVPLTCTAAKNQVASTPYIVNAVLSTSIPSELVCDAIEYFCCAKVTEITSVDPGYASTPFIDLGEGNKKYKIASQNDVFCKIIQ